MAVLWALRACDEVSSYGFGRHPLAGTPAAGGARRDFGAYKYYTDDPDKPWVYGHKWSVEDALCAPTHARTHARKRRVVLAVPR
jgi:hypothetical protein